MAQHAPSHKNWESSLIGKSDAWNKILYEVKALANAPSSLTVLLTGETGTGKEIVSQAIHKSSDRAGKPFIAINCAAIPSDLLESVLFGYEKGAFTGAYAKNIGKFEQAEGGTILLDEMGELSLPLQAKLLRVIQEKCVDRLGGRESVPVDVRIIAATHCDLQDKVIKREFREDLFYRLNVYPIELPPLRSRTTDIALLVEHFAKQLQNRGYPPIIFSESAIQRLTSYSWPGNVRELINAIERMAVHAAQHGLTTIEAGHLQATITSRSSNTELFRAGQHTTTAIKTEFPQNFNLENHLSQVEAHYLRAAIERSNGNISKAARLLSIPRTTMLSKMKVLDIRSHMSLPGLSRKKETDSLSN